jgi:hypothetical protein
LPVGTIVAELAEPLCPVPVPPDPLVGSGVLAVGSAGEPVDVSAPVAVGLDELPSAEPVLVDEPVEPAPVVVPVSLLPVLEPEPSEASVPSAGSDELEVPSSVDEVLVEPSVGRSLASGTAVAGSVAGLVAAARWRGLVAGEAGVETAAESLTGACVTGAAGLTTIPSTSGVETALAARAT